MPAIAIAHRMVAQQFALCASSRLKVREVDFHLTAAAVVARNLPQITRSVRC